MFHIPVKGTDLREDVDSDLIPDRQYPYVLYKGLEAIVGGRGRAKIGAKTSWKGTAEEFAAKGLEVFREQREALYKDETKHTGVGGKAKARGEEAKLKTEINRIAKKDAESLLKANNYKPARVSTELKNQIASALIAQDPDKYRKAALESLAAAAKTKSESTLLKSLGLEIKEDPALVAKAEEASKKRKKPAEAKAPSPPPRPQNLRGISRPGIRN
jgi:hypothetical protein